VTHALHFTATPTAAEEAAVRGALRDANAAAGFPHDTRPLAVLLRDAAGAVVGGLWGRTGWSWLYIENLAVPPALRGQGHGAALLRMAEAEARARGCIGVRLDTYSFQARPFYERRGYALVGVLKDCPPGQTRYSMAKRLDGGGSVAEPWPEAAAPRATITRTEAEFEPAAAVALAGLIQYNEEATGPIDYTPLNLVVRRPGEAEPAGGLIGMLFYRWLYVRILYLPEDLRRGGLGATLLRRAESAARDHGCIGAWLDTFAFQARPFYEKQGYRVFGSLADFPPGHARHYLMKRLDGADGDN
jgi:GNAT superfamily N-acetyltransferase